MSITRLVTAALVASLLVTAPATTSSAGNSSDPVVRFVRPAGGTTIGGDVPYGAIRVSAFDRDAGKKNGDGVAKVVLTVRDAATGKIVRRKVEKWAPYDFGLTLKNGRYRLNARAKARGAAGGTWNMTSIVVTVNNGRRDLPTPPTVITRQKAANASLAALNRTRASVGAPPVRLNVTMSDFAYFWSTKMIRSGFKHSSAGYAENIAWHSDDGMTAVAAAKTFNRMWVDSSGHYRNMTNRSHTRVGIGLVRHASGWWATHVFD